MDRQFRDVYQSLFEFYQTSSELPTERGGSGMLPISVFLRQMINNAEIELGARQQIRSDGKYFLLTNFYTMVFLPLFIGNRGDIDLEDLLRAIDADIKDIVTDAAGNDQAHEISGHALLNSASKRWPFLKTTRFNLWGDE